MGIQQLTKQEIEGWWKQKSDDFTMYKIRELRWVELSTGAVDNYGRAVTNSQMYITIASFIAPMSLALFREYFELTEPPKDYTLDNEIKHAMLQVAPTSQLKWDEMNTEQTIKAMDFIRAFWDRNVDELIVMEGKLND
mgnify:CR=1 FL=1